jgi:hypothetical protein
MKIFTMLFAAFTLAVLGLGSGGETASAADIAAAAMKSDAVAGNCVRKVQSTHSRWRSHYRWGSSRGRQRQGGY